MRFNVNDSVRIVRVGQDRLDNATGVILGPTMESMTPDGYYIVLLDVPLADRRAIVITEHCLERLPTQHRPEDLLPTYYPCE